ncbi:ParA family protein [Burkholderia sp. MBR-1]|uniref:ParA family protein n=1 Tax=Burkholderia sp. MBR-1 TaxID=2732364 RepID=UPI0015EEFE42|nr:ParA family protein [Burkholderia sp. MBR-1]QMI49993.1 ParA family protein [Burkholderia sp. MBR-1]
MKVVAVTSPKGGVAKTTTAMHVAHYAADKGLRTLLIDGDEGDLSIVFQHDDPARYLTTRDMFLGNPEGLPLRSVRPNLSLVEAGEDLADLHDLPGDLLAAMEEEFHKLDSEVSVPRLRQLFSQIQERFVLPFESTLQSVASQFDLCVIDTPPYLARRSLAILCASDGVVTPTNISAFTFSRIEKLEKALDFIARDFNPRLKHLGFIMAKINSHSRNEVEGVDVMRSAYGNRVFPGMILDRACVSTSLALGKPVWHSSKAGAQRAAAAEMRDACRTTLLRLGFDIPA